MKPPVVQLRLFSLLTATHLLLFLALSHSKKNVLMCIVDLLFFFFLSLVTMDQNKEKRHGNVSTLLLLF